MASTFGAKIDELKERVGSGDLVGSVVADQLPTYTPDINISVSTSSILAAAARCT